jgi:hypothetical protein
MIGEPKMSTECCRSDADRKQPKYWEKNPFPCHFVHHKSHTDWPGIEKGRPRWQTARKILTAQIECKINQVAGKYKNNLRNLENAQNFWRKGTKILQIMPRRILLWSLQFGLDGSGIESRLGGDFPFPSRTALGPTPLLYDGYRVFPGGKAAGSWHRG